jgi:hypothetical protein
LAEAHTTLDIADWLLITRVQLEPEGDTRFPCLDQSVWEEISRLSIRRERMTTRRSPRRCMFAGGHKTRASALASPTGSSRNPDKKVGLGRYVSHRHFWC